MFTVAPLGMSDCCYANEVYNPVVKLKYTLKYVIYETIRFQIFDFTLFIIHSLGKSPIYRMYGEKNS